MIILGGNQGQRGDLIIGTVLARAIKEKFPNSKYILGINKQYYDMHPLFKNHPYIDDTIQWDGYDNWPTNNDVEIISRVNPDILLHPMPQHPNNHCWFNLVNHLTESTCIMNGFVPPKNLNCYLNKYFETYSDYQKTVCISPFTAWQNKNISIEKWEKIIEFIKSNGFNVIQIGPQSEKQIAGAEKIETSYFESVKIMLSCKFLVGLDGGMSWVASAYEHPAICLYGYHFNNLYSAKIYQPYNKNATYLESKSAEEIPLTEIKEKIFKKLND